MRYVRVVEPASIRATMRIRDGIPLASPHASETLAGSVLTFAESASSEAYASIVAIEPGDQYFWGETAVGTESVNVLWGKSPERGADDSDARVWDGRNDPLFTSALDVVEECLVANREFDWDLKPMFRLQAAYLLLWSAVERYLSLRYHLGEKVVEKLRHLATEPAFVEALAQRVSVPRAVYRAGKPSDRVCLAPGDPSSAVKYYYQVRSNLSHRGKAVPKDHERIAEALTELLPIFRAVLDAAFRDASSDV